LIKQKWMPSDILTYLCAYPPQQVQQLLQDTRFLRGLRAFVIACIERKILAERRARKDAGIPED
jgi:hypothetical protein